MFGMTQRLSYLWDMNETNTHKMTSRRTFAIALSKGPVQVSQVSKKLDRVVALWLSRGEINMVNDTFTLAS